ncbi:MAG: hypothetical protein FWG67_01390 [Defluviitaleaceae bacterium]|nr:hypothetical protein [Defluviitaleaceae bacterium]
MGVKTGEENQSNGKIKFIIGAIIGAFLFLVPIPTGDGAFNIPLGIVSGWLNDLSVFGEGNTEDIRVWLAYVFIVISFLATVFAHVVKPKFIMENAKLKEVLLTGPLYVMTRLLAFVLFTMVLFELDGGPRAFWMAGDDVPTIAALLTDRWDGAGLMVFDFITSLTTIFLVLAFAIPLLTDFGLMEFIGILIKKFINTLFLLPGRASVDLVASWFGSSAVSVIITRDQHEKGFYTGREAAVICANFALVSVPFSLVVANEIGLGGHFPLWYLVISLVCLILGVIMPRMWPFRSMPDTYVEGVEKQIDEEVEAGESRFYKAVAAGSERASQTTVTDVVSGGLHAWLTSFLDLFPVIIAWGTLALFINAATPILTWVSWPMGWFLQVLRVPGGADYAAITVIGLVDMFLPAIFLGSETYFNTRFILGALSIVQIIYLAETGVLILKSKIPLGLGQLVALFFIRTIIGLPLIVLFTWILTTLGLMG